MPATTTMGMTSSARRTTEEAAPRPAPTVVAETCGCQPPPAAPGTRIVLLQNGQRIVRLPLWSS
jgi:hypothetical protein